jgi:ubiquinone/menaquinone biosynthesis C-methylase UbiE
MLPFGEDIMRQRLVQTARWVFQRLPRWLRRDFDYRTAYRQANLERDYWSIVGPTSKDEFQDLARGKFQLLLAQGLTPGSRILDVGCGTGQLTETLADYLSPEGLYYGTDIASEAIAFCQKRFRRSNFFFVQNEMTRIPLEGLSFDFIYLGSVFTHMYPEEIQALLPELDRLLAPRGIVIADAFVSPTASQFVGGRGMVVINATQLQELFATTGLQVQRLHHWECQGEVQRVLFKFTHGSSPES